MSALRSTFLGMSYSSHHFASILELLDRRGTGRSEEPIRTALLLACLEQIPDLSQTLLGGVLVDMWRSGGDHEGDLVALDSGRRVITHIKVKGPTTQINRSDGTCHSGSALSVKVK